jgi:arylsulfatase A-like enzyme
MLRKSAIVLLIVFTLPSFALASQTPNIVFVLADDLGYGDIGCYNPSSKIPTPNIDRLATQGIRFSNAYTPSSVCTPTRYGLMTGEYCWRGPLKLGVILGEAPALIEPGRTTVSSFLTSRGYATACIGKWHLGQNWTWKEGAPEDKRKTDQIDFTKRVTGGANDLGFDYSFVYVCALDFPPYCFLENGKSVGLPTESIEEESKRLPPRYREQQPGLAVPGWKNSEMGPTITRKAIEWLEKQHHENPEQPFFLYLPTSSPHVPYAPPDFVMGKSQAGRRGDMCAEVDWTVGEVMKTLDRLQLTEETLVIFTSDNGAIIGDRKEGTDDIGPEEIYETYGHRANGPFQGQKWTVFEGGFRVPFVARWPGRIDQDTLSSEIICLTDFLATLAAILGEELPPDAGRDSVNILPALLGEQRTTPIRESVVLHSQMGMFAIRKGQWKLIEGHGRGAWYANSRPAHPGEPPGRLYNIVEDPGETTNVWNDHPEIVKRMLALLEAAREPAY